MKKMSLLFATLLVLVSSIIFCGCGDKYKKLNISLGQIMYGSETYFVKEGEIGLVLDDPILSKCGVMFNVSGVKEWGAVSVTSSPAEAVKVDSCNTNGTTCNVVVSALQPVEGGQLIITHLGSGKDCKVPLNIGKRLQDVKANNSSYVLRRPENEDEVKYEIPTDELLSCKPLNYSDVIVWELTTPVNGVEVVSYDRKSSKVDSDHLQYAVRSEIVISNKLKDKTTITISPISILDGEVTHYKDQKITVYITDLLDVEDIAIMSDTHGDSNHKLHELALISNPDKDNSREDVSYAEYDLFSTAVFELKKVTKVENPNTGEVDESYEDLKSFNQHLLSIHDITASSNIHGLTLEYVEFGKIRAIATSTCYGSGYINIRFSPKNCLGDINSFELSVPCTVGERATSFSVVNNGERVHIENSNNSDYDFKAITPLNDSNSVGQAFRFEMLSTNTLSDLKQYKITINKNLLYIKPEYIINGSSPYIYANDNDLYNLSEIEGNLYQISILKDGNQIKFYSDVDSDYFISEPLYSRNTIYIKWNLVKDKDLHSNLDFGISVSNWYNGKYDATIGNNEFGKTQIKLKLDFNRQRTVGNIDYKPTKAVLSQSGGELWEVQSATDAETDWQFYLSNDMLKNKTNYYGFHISDVFGLNNETLNDEEKGNININVTIRHKNCEICTKNNKSQCDCETNLGFEVLDIYKNDVTFESKLENYNYIKDTSEVILLGLINEEKAACGDYIIEFRQAGSTEYLITRELTVYEPLKDDDINVDIPLANFKGDVYDSQGKKYVKATGVTEDNWESYYVYSEGSGYSRAISYDSETEYYSQIDVVENIEDISDIYVLATSSQYLTKFDYTNRNFIGDAGISVELQEIGDLKYDKSNMCGTDENGNQIIKTGLIGTFDAKNGKENFIKITYTISVYNYDYYKISTTTTDIEKDVYIYIYKPVTQAVLNKTNIEKYNHPRENDVGYNNDLMELYGKETLALSLNNGDADVFNYVNVVWSNLGGVVDLSNKTENSCTFTFRNTTDKKVTGKLIATINQFGIEIPVYCSYSIQKPVLSNRVELDTAVNVFKSGQPYINLKVGESKQFSATVKGEYDKPASFNIVEYLVCSLEGTQSNGIATVSSNGLLTATHPGKAKLIIVAKDSVDKGWKADNTNYLSYVEGKPCVIVDIIVSDGSVANPYLIANSNDFKNIQNDFVNNVNENHYALVSNINLNGQGVTFNGDFSGSISSFKQYENDDTRFRIAGIMLNCDNPVVFTNLTGTIENVSFNLDINYIENNNQNKGDVSIALIGINSGLINEVTVIADGRVIVEQSQNSYTIASLVAINNDEINLTDIDVVAVEANIKVEGNSTSAITLGGIIGQNNGNLKGAQLPYSSDKDDEFYSNIYYGKQGVTAYVNLQVTNSSEDGALGGAIGFNNGGNVTNVLTDGTVYGVGNNQELKVNNVGGIIGKNAAKMETVGNELKYVDMPAEITIDGIIDLYVSNAEFTGSEFQITESYSTAKVKGYQNVGGAVGHDTHGSFKHVYYEMYTSGEGVVGQENVGGLIGNANNSDLLYCYANNFGWGYKPKEDVTTYDIIGDTSVGGLIGLANSEETAPSNGKHTSLEITTVISSAASVTINGSSNVAGLIGLIEQDKFAAIYTAYYYGVIDATAYEGIANYNTITMLPYYNVYWIVNGVDSKEHTTYGGYYKGPETESENPSNGFMLYGGQNNNEPYIVYKKGKNDQLSNIINPIPTLITINDSLIDWWYKQDDNGEYYINEGNYVLYTKGVEGNPTRYTLRGSVIGTGDANSNPSDYRTKALILYYYGLTDIADEDVLEAAYEFNKVNMDDIINEKKILIVPDSLRRVTLKSSDTSIIRVLDDGYLLLLNEGQVTITMTSIINPSVSASFVVIVRSKVKAFSLHTSASLHNDFVINNDSSLSIVKGSSKIIYPNVKSTVNYFDKEFNYKPATRVGTQLTITCPDDNATQPEVNIKDYIELNGTLCEDECKSVWYDTDGKLINITNITPNPETDKQVFTQLVYRIPFGTPITISVKDYCEETFNVEAVPYVISGYKADDGTSTNSDCPILQGYKSTFEISTKRGASAINTNKNQMVMMPADSETNLNVKIATDTVQKDIYIDVEAIGDAQILDPKDLTKTIDVVDMLELSAIATINNTTTALNKTSTKNNDLNLIKYKLNYPEDTLQYLDLTNNLQEFELKLKLNEKSHYINKSLKLQITIYLLDAEENKVTLDGQYVQAVTFIDIEPQIMSSMIARNYRRNGEKLDLDGKIRDKNLNQSTLIRPGSVNIISIDIAPNIAIYDYVEIVDNSTVERILLRQIYKNTSGAYQTPDNMDEWVDNGIKLRKLGSDGKDNIEASQLFVEARLPIKSITNITHTLSVVAYRDGQAVYTTYLNLESIAYPTVIMTYTPPKGEPVEVDTSASDNVKPDETGKIVVSAEKETNLAVGVEASITVQTHNIDEGSLTPEIKMYNADGDELDANNIFNLEYRYGKYILLFNKENKDNWSALLGNTIHLSFSASKSVNGATEYCKATIKFTIRKMVIHAVSMTHTSSQGDLYGDWDNEFVTQFYFDKTDISYYNNASNTYWNTEYELQDDSAFDGITDRDLKDDLQQINDILTSFNSGFGGAKEISLTSLNNLQIDLENNNSQTFDRQVIDGEEVETGFKIKNEDNQFKIHAKDPSINRGKDINDYRLNVRFAVEYGTDYYPSYYPTISSGTDIFNSFGFNVSKKTTPFDEYITIYTQEQFEDMLEGKYYQLGNDITLNNYTPTNVAIGGFNGGEYSITIASFNEDQLRNDYLTGDINIGLFGTLAENSVIQNLKVVYSNQNNMDLWTYVDLNQTFEEHPGNNIYFGGIAAVNLGVITNVEVSGQVEIKASNIAAQLIYCGGITALNGDNSAETQKIATITNSTVTLHINAIASVGGIAQTNNGKISTTNFDGRISSYMATTSFVSDVLTAGFVVNNSNGATISLSYIEFTRKEDNIRSVGDTAGFVLDNAGTISNCYINGARIFTQGSIGGFVFSSSGSIVNCYSKIETEDSLFYSKFIKDISSMGSITNCYCITDETNNPKIPGLEIIKIIDIRNTKWNGFIFAEINNNGLWTKTTNGPKLVKAGFNSNYKEYDNIYNIYDVETYEGWLGQFDKDKNYTIEGITIEIVRDIDFEAEGFVGSPTTINKTLMANINGNNMEIRNFSIYKLAQDEDILVGDENYYVGLFKQINRAYIRNLNLAPAEVKASSVYAVGALAGVMDSVRLYNININNDDLLILGRNAVGGLAGIITGEFEIIGITSNVSVLSNYRHGTNKQYNMYFGKNVTGVSGISNISEVSYAGSVAGIIDGYGNQTPQGDIDFYQKVEAVLAGGTLVLAGENVGALFGLVGETTLIKNSHYIVPANAKYQGVYVSGGLVGENRGIIQGCSITAQVSEGVRASTEECFNTFSKINGGIVGTNVGGLIDNCIVDVDVCTKVNFATVGGVIGRNIEGSVYNTTISGGRLKGYFIGGIVGADYSYEIMSKTLTGEATITKETLQVFNSLYTEGFNKYQDNSVTTANFDEEKPFTNNVLSSVFIQTFIANKVYTYNTSYAGELNKLINTSSIYGLIIGYTVHAYGLTQDTDFAYEQDQAIVTLSLVDSDYKPDGKFVVNKDKNVNVTCIKQIEDKTLINMFNPDEQVKIIYLVAYENATTYESWSSASGYSNKFIIAGNLESVSTS